MGKSLFTDMYTSIKESGDVLTLVYVTSSFMTCSLCKGIEGTAQDSIASHRTRLL